MDKKLLSPALLVLLLVLAPLFFARPAPAEPFAAEQSAGGGGDRKDGQDPMVGTWECSNGVFTHDFFFQADGTLIQQEPTFHNTRNARWIRLSDQEISIEGGPVLTVTMDGDSRLSVVDNKVGSTWDCSRK